MSFLIPPAISEAGGLFATSLVGLGSAVVTIGSEIIHDPASGVIFDSTVDILEGGLDLTECAGGL